MLINQAKYNTQYRYKDIIHNISDSLRREKYVDDISEYTKFAKLLPNMPSIAIPREFEETMNALDYGLCIFADRMCDLNSFRNKCDNKIEILLSLYTEIEDKENFTNMFNVVTKYYYPINKWSKQQQSNSINCPYPVDL